MIVVDASVIVDVLVAGPTADTLRTFVAGEQLSAPTLLDHEVVSALRGLVLGRHLSAQRASDALKDYDDLPVRRWLSTAAFRRRAFDLRDRLSVYDAAYVGLAEALRCPLVTRDARLGRATGHHAAVEVR